MYIIRCTEYAVTMYVTYYMSNAHVEHCCCDHYSSVYRMHDHDDDDDDDDEY